MTQYPFYTISKKAILVMASFFLFASCEKPTEDLGFNQVVGDQIDADSLHLPLITYTAPIDSLLVALPYQQQQAIGGYSRTRIMGRQESPIFGVAQADFVGQVLPQDVNPDFGSNPVVDSVNLFLRTTRAYGDTTSPMSIEVHELSREFSRDSAFYSNYNPGNERLLGSISNHLPRPKTPRDYEGDLEAPVVRIPLDRDYFQTQFADVGDGNFDGFSTFRKFVEYFKGIRISAPQGRAVLGLDMSSAFTSLRIHYHNDQDTSVVALNFLQDRSEVPIHFSVFEHDYSQARFDLRQQDTIHGEEETYVQAMGGVATALKFDPAKVDSLSREGLVINKAFLELSTAVGTGDPSPPSERMEIRHLDGKGLGSITLDAQDERLDGNLRLGVFRDNKYVFDLTRHIFQVLNTRNNSTLAVVPTTRTTGASRTILRGGSNVNEKAKLIIYYSKP